MLIFVIFDKVVCEKIRKNAEKIRGRRRIDLIHITSKREDDSVHWHSWSSQHRKKEFFDLHHYWLTLKEKRWKRKELLTYIVIQVGAETREEKNKKSFHPHVAMSSALLQKGKREEIIPTRNYKRERRWVWEEIIPSFYHNLQFRNCKRRGGKKEKSYPHDEIFNMRCWVNF